MSFQLSLYSLQWIKTECKIKYMQKRGDKNNDKNKSVVKMHFYTCFIGGYFWKRIQYWLGIGLELLSTCFVAEVCEVSKVFLIQKEPLSMTVELSKSMRWSNSQACFAMFIEPFAQVFTFLMCSFFQVFTEKNVFTGDLETVTFVARIFLWFTFFTTNS